MKTYAIIGCGRQGIAAAFDFIKFGNANKLYLIDNNKETLNYAYNHLVDLTGFTNIELCELEVTETPEITEVLEDCDAAVSAVPYYYNLSLTECAIEARCSLTDLGGNTDVVKKQLKLNNKAAEAGITVIPDCGMDPGLSMSLIEYILTQFDEVEEIKNYGGGLPLEPKPPWNYELYFHINGLTNEYYGNSIFIRDGKLIGVPCFSEQEVVEIDGLGKLEANVTNGGLSTLPWKLQGVVQRLENRTLRYPGHWEWFKAYSELGLFEEEPVDFNGCKISPREFYHFLLEPKLKTDNPRDVGIVMVTAKGIKNGENKSLTVSVTEKYDEKINFTAMQKLTGWHASAMAILAAAGKTNAGVLSVDEAVKGKTIMQELAERGFEFVEKWE